MSNDKRQRQREARVARLEAMRAAQRARQRRRQAVYAVAGIGVVVLLAMVAMTRSGDDSQDVSAGASTTTTGDPAETPCEQTPPTTRPTPFDQTIDTARTYTATVTTDVGDFTIELADDRAPKTVNNFVNLARSGFYDCVPFHRVIPGFVVQGGDATEGSGTGGPGYEFEDELPQPGEYEIGSVAMANSGANTNGSQFFVVTGEQGAALGPNYSLFGTVVEGMDVVKQIEADGSDGGTPTRTHYMVTVTIEEK